MALDQQMMHSVVRLIGDDVPDAVLRKRTVIGTGFLMTVRSERDPGVRYGYVVTTAHNLRDQTRIEVQAPNPQPEGGLHDPEPIYDWRRPLEGVDIAIAPWLPESDSRFFSVLTMEDLLLPDEAQLFLGMPIYYIGILTPLDRPMVRSGTLGAISEHGLPHQADTFDYVAHLVDCRSYGGFSGSPCYIVIERPILVPKPPPAYEAELDKFPPLGHMGYFARLCGMFTQHLADRAPMGPVSLYGVGVMLRSQEIRRALMSDELKNDRRRKDEESLER